MGGGSSSSGGEKTGVSTSISSAESSPYIRFEAEMNKLRENNESCLDFTNKKTRNSENQFEKFEESKKEIKA